MNKSILAIITVAAAVGGSAFFGGIKYAQNKTPQGRLSSANLQNLSPGEHRQRIQELGANAGAGFRGGAGGQRGEFTAGEIIAKDDKSVTVKLQNGGSKIIFLSNSTEITKSTDGSISDLDVGKNITINGAVNPDGSVTAQTIQLRSVRRTDL